MRAGCHFQVRRHPVSIPSVRYLADGTRLQLVADRSAVVAQTAAFERHLNGLWGVFIMSVLSVVFLAGFAFLPRRY